MKNMIFKCVMLFSALIVICGFTSAAHAIPAIQLYIPGSTYVGGSSDDWVKESWFTENSAFEIQVIVSAAFSDLNLVISVPEEYGSITVNGSTYLRSTTITDFIYGTPVIGNKKNGDPINMPSHGVYGTYYKVINLGEVKIGDLTENVYNMVEGSSAQKGKIFSLDFSKTGFIKTHFDAYGDGKFAPFSHDAEDGPLPPSTPEPATIALMGMGLAGFLGFRRKKSIN